MLALIAGGYSSKQIAGQLGITFKTAVCHRSNILQKLKIHDTATLTRFAVRNRIVRP